MYHCRYQLQKPVFPGKIEFNSTGYPVAPVNNNFDASAANHNNPNLRISNTEQILGCLPYYNNNSHHTSTGRNNMINHHKSPAADATSTTTISSSSDPCCPCSSASQSVAAEASPPVDCCETGPPTCAYCPVLFSRSRFGQAYS